MAIQFTPEQMAQYNAYVMTLTPEQKLAYDMQLYRAFQAAALSSGVQVQHNPNLTPEQHAAMMQANAHAQQQQQQPQLVAAATPGYAGAHPQPGIAPTAPAAAGAPSAQAPADMDMDDDDAITLEPMVVENSPYAFMLPPPEVAQPKPVEPLPAGAAEPQEHRMRNHDLL